MLRQDSETRFDPGAWLILAGVLGFALLVATMTVAILAGPADGWQIPFDDPALTLTYFYGDWPTPLRQGDQVLAVEGLDVAGLYGLRWDASPPSSWRAGGSVSYMIRRGDQVLEVSVPLERPGAAGVWRALANAAPDSPLELSWPLVALIVFWRRPHSQAARLLLVAMISHVAVTKVSWAATTVAANFAPLGLHPLYLFVTNFWSWLFWPTIIWLVLSFPLPVWPLSRWPRQVPALLYGLPLGAVLITLATGNTLPVAVALVGELMALLLALGLAVVNAARHRADRVARAQASWVLLGFGVSLGLLLLLYMIDAFLSLAEGLPERISAPLTLALPVCLGIAITRYRLWDIDIVIRRTLIYSVLTGLLTAGYFGCVLVLQSIARLLATEGQGQLVTVISTLAIAALFLPLRQGVQNFIDRRFYRRKYDAAQTLATFGASLRDETDLEALNQRLVSVVAATLEPESVGVWLRPPPQKGSG